MSFRCLVCKTVSAKAEWRLLPDPDTGVPVATGPRCVLCGGKAVQDD